MSADGKGLVSGAGGLLVAEAVRVSGLRVGLSRGLGGWRPARAIYDPGKIIAELAVAVALGGDGLADIAVVRAEPDLYGPVASDLVVSRLVTALAADPVRAVRAIRAAVRRLGSGSGPWPVMRHRERAGGGLEKENARPTWKTTFGLLTELPESSSQFRGRAG